MLGNGRLGQGMADMTKPFLAPRDAQFQSDEGSLTVSDSASVKKPDCVVLSFLDEGAAHRD